MDDAHESTEETSQLIPACIVIANCPLSADIVLVSSDGHRFGTHRRNLGDFTGVFPVDIAPVNGEDVPMPDLDSKALALFLQYVHHHRQPDLSGVPFKSLFQLAEAVEKYDVYSATEICKVQMSPHVENHCLEVFQYASRHNYRKLMDDAALVAVQEKYLNKKLVELCNRPDLQPAWDRYTDYWFHKFDICYDDPPPVQHRGGGTKCKKWQKFRSEVLSQVKRENAIFSSFDDIVEGAKYHLADCRHCGIRADHWTSRVRGNGFSTPFSTFLS